MNRVYANEESRIHFAVVDVAGSWGNPEYRYMIRYKPGPGMSIIPTIWDSWKRRWVRGKDILAIDPKERMPASRRPRKEIPPMGRL